MSSLERPWTEEAKILVADWYNSCKTSFFTRMEKEDDTRLRAKIAEGMRLSYLVGVEEGQSGKMRVEPIEKSLIRRLVKAFKKS